MPVTAPRDWEWAAAPRWRYAAAGTLVLFISWLVLLVRYRAWTATDDIAILQLALEEMRDGRIPLVGPYSRLDFRHPGPVREWLFFLPYLASGARSAALPATTVIFHTVMFGLAIRAGWKWAATRGVITASAGVVLMYAAIGQELAFPWNPYLAASAMFAAVWGLLAFLRTGGWVQAVVCASFAAQMHAPALPLAATVVGIVVAIAIARTLSRRSADEEALATERRPRALTIAAVMGLVVLWIGPLLDALGSDSNISAAIEASGSGDSAGLSSALAFAGRIVDPSAVVAGTFLQWSGEGRSGDGGLPWLLAWLLIAAAALGAVVWRRDRRGQLDLAVIAVLALAAVVTMSRFVPEYYGYLFGSITAVAVVAMTGVVSVGIAALRPDPAGARATTSRHVVIAVAGSALILAGTVAGVRSMNSTVVDRRSLAADGAVAAAVEPSQTYAVTAGGTTGAIVQAEVALTIERSNAEATSDLFPLALPTDDGDSPLFVVGMTATRQCLLDLGVGEVVLDGVIDATGEPIVIVLAAADERQALRPCLPF